MGDNNNMASRPHTLELLEQLRASFVAELPERCNKLEELILTFGGDPHNHGLYEELYRAVHSLKGSGGSYGLPIITQICHQLEDQLNSLNTQHWGIDEDQIDVCLKHIDLVRQSAQLTANTEPDFSSIEHALSNLKEGLLQDRFSCLIVDISSLMAMMCKDALTGLPVHPSMADNGLAALERLLHNHYDFLVTGKELKVLNGAALISALRASESANRNIKTIMVTSTADIHLPPGGKPDYLITRDKKFPEKLHATAKELIQGIKKQSPPAARAWNQ